MSVRKRNKLIDCPVNGKYWYIIEVVQDIYGKGRGSILKIVPESVTYGEGDTLQQHLLFHDSCYKVYQFDNKIDFDEFYDKMILVSKMKR